MRALLIALLLALPGGAAWPQQADPARQAPPPAPYGMRPLWSMPEAPPPAAGDAAAGRAVAMGSERRAGWACAQCHGLHGAAEGSGGFPRLAGLSAWYLYRQLQDYAAGRRRHDVMTPIAREMSEREMRDVAAWYAAQGQAPLPPPPLLADARRRQQGGAVAAVGVPERGVPACSNCHGLQGEGAGPAVPALAGQYAAYTALQLRLWKQGERRNGPLGVMADVAQRLSAEEIEAVAAFYAALRPNAGAAQAQR